MTRLGRSFGLSFRYSSRRTVGSTNMTTVPMATAIVLLSSCIRSRGFQTPAPVGYARFNTPYIVPTTGCFFNAATDYGRCASVPPAALVFADTGTRLHVSVLARFNTPYIVPTTG